MCCWVGWDGGVWDQRIWQRRHWNWIDWSGLQFTFNMKRKILRYWRKWLIFSSPGAPAVKTRADRASHCIRVTLSLFSERITNQNKQRKAKNDILFGRDPVYQHCNLHSYMEVVRLKMQNWTSIKPTRYVMPCVIIIFVCFQARRRNTMFGKKKKIYIPVFFFFLSWSQSQHYNVIKWQIYKIKLTDAYTSLYHDQTQKEVHMCSLNTCFYIALKSSYSFLCTLSVLL